MSLSSGIKKICESLGRDNNPAYVVVAIAAAKGIFRPLFTMMDRKESSETKKYTALREGLTEVIAIPTYLACGAIAAKGASLCKDAKKAEMAKHNLRFVGVCTAALFVIPGLCSVVVKPFTDRIFHKHNEDKKEGLDITSGTTDVHKLKTPISQTGHLNQIKPVSFSVFQNSGMKVG